ncbi:MAG: hypothetical protein ACRDXE_08240, partial [Acidimicrobiales bacterium]
MATCAMRRVLAEAEALLLLSREIRATAKSRLSNGILLIPSELSFGPIDPTRDSGDGEETDDPFDDELAKAMITPIQEEGSAAAVVPLVIRGPAEALQHVSHIALDKTLDPVLDARIEQRILRIARGLNMPVEVTTGLMATTYANAVQVKQSEFEDHIEPRAVLVCDAVTSGYFQWALEQAGVDPKIARTIFVWYDAGALIIKPDQSEQAGNAHQDGVISDAARRKYQGFTEDDAPPDDEILRRLLLKGGRMDPFIEANLFILTKLAPDMPVPAPPAGILGQEHSVSAMPIPGAPEGPVADPTPSPHPTAGAPTRSTPIAAATRAITTGAAGAGWAGTGARLAAIDRELRARIVGALDQAMRAALERAGNRAKAKAQRDKGGVTHSVRAAADNVAASEVAATVGKAVLNAAGISDDELISGAFTRVLDDVMAWMAAAVAQAEAVVVKAGGPLPDTVARTRAAAVATHLSDAREWLDTNLAHLAALRLYEPTPTAPAEGEYDGTVLIPTGLVRAAIAVAGGTKPHGGTMVAAGWTAIAGGPLTDGGGDPVGGIGTGPDTMGAASAVGAETEAWEWQYGAGTRNPFIPHENLDGSIAASFDDPAWANTSGFPATGYYFPGDHDGCGCDIAPVMV